MFPNLLMYAASGVIVVIVNGQMMAELASSTSVFTTTVCVEVATLGALIVMLMRPAGVVSKTAV